MRYTEEMKKKVIDEFTRLIGKPFTAARIKENGGIALYVKLTGKPLGPESIATSLDRFANPEKYRNFASNQYKNKKSQLDSTNQLFNLMQDKPYILIPSHGDIFCFDTTQEVQEAIEKSQSTNMSVIKFKLLKALSIKVSTKVSCKIE